MSNLSRQKGLGFELEVSRAFAADGWAVRGLEGHGDQLCVRAGDNRATAIPAGLTLHVECKRYATRARWEEWLTQVQADAPAGIPWVLVTRADRRAALATLPLAALLELIG